MIPARSFRAFAVPERPEEEAKMKGIVFTEFLELVGRKYGVEMMDLFIEASDLPSGGAYTAVGTYDHGEMLALVQNLSTAIRVPVPELLKTYGQHLFARFSVRYPKFFAEISFPSLRSIT